MTRWLPLLAVLVVAALLAVDPGIAPPGAWICMAGASAAALILLLDGRGEEASEKIPGGLLWMLLAALLPYPLVLAAVIALSLTHPI